MSYNGSGSFSLVAGNPVVTGTTISSTTHNNTNNDIATGLSTALCKDGQQTPTANLPMGGFKLTGLAAGSAANDSVRLTQAQNSAMHLLGSVSGTNTIAAAATPTLTAYASGQTFRFIPANTNTGATTLNIDGLGAKNIYLGNAALTAGEIRQNVPCEVIYDGTQFQLIGPFAGGAVAGAVTLSGGVTVPTSATGKVYSDSYTPTVTNGANVAASTPRLCNFLRVGNIVHVAGIVEIDPTAGATTTNWSLSLPVASNFTTVYQAAGAGSNVDGESAYVEADTTNDVLAFTAVPTSNANKSWSFSASYGVA